MGECDIAPRILNLGTRCRWVVSFMPRLLYSQERNIRYSMCWMDQWTNMIDCYKRTPEMQKEAENIFESVTFAQSIN